MARALTMPRIGAAMAIPRMITDPAQAAAALANYAEWWRVAHAAAYRRHTSVMGAFDMATVDDLYPAEVPPRPPSLAALGPVDPDTPPVAYFRGRRVATARPVQASIRPRFDIRDPLATGDNGVRVKRPGVALAAVLTDLDHLAAVVGAYTALAQTCRTAGLTERGGLWQAEADEVGAFTTRHAEDTIPTLGAAFLAEWRALAAIYAAPEVITAPVRPPIMPARLR